MWIKTGDGKLFDISTGNSIMIDYVNGKFMVEMILTGLDLDRAKLIEYEDINRCKNYEFNTDDCEFSIKVIEDFVYEENAQKYLDKLAEKLGAEVINIDED